jgi:two-component system chemotaxis response regulator CheB
MPSGGRAGRDIVLIGGSAGSLDPILSIVTSLPKGFPAAIFIVIHTGPQPGHLPEIIESRTGILARYAIHGEPVRQGRIYIAPPDNHMTVEPGVVRVFRGPRENGSRPAVDPLFRSAARAYGRRVIGVIVSGALDCGAQGMRAIGAVGGVTVVQDPEEALFPEMPRAVRSPQHVLRVAEIPSLLALLVAQAPSARKSRPPVAVEKGPADLSCPECHGPLTELVEAGAPEFTCHLGHAYSIGGLASEQSRDLETALWSALRSLRESERLARRLGATRGGVADERFREKAESLAHQAKLLESFLLRRAPRSAFPAGGTHPVAKPPGAPPGSPKKRRR